MRAAGVDHPLVDSGTIADQVRELMPEGVDAVLELVGCSVLADTLRTVRRHGMVCFTGALAGQWTIPDFTPFMIPNGVRPDVLRRSGRRPPGPRLRPPAPGHRRREPRRPGREGPPRTGP
nr:hypothetical protein [Streptomyces sp. SCL15-6]